MKLTWKQIRQMDQPTRCKLARAGWTKLRGSRLDRSLSTAEQEDVISENIAKLWELAYEPEKIARIRAPLAYFKAMVYHEAQRVARRQPISQPLSDWEPADTDSSPVYRLEILFRIMESVFGRMQREGKGECVELLRDTYYRDLSDRELAELFGMKEISVRGKRRRCIQYFRDRMHDHPEYETLIDH